ncbi:GTP cyclohydrolase I FolE [Penaeicola halotolerans]|uniref:GTP cyclohydrolase I FolE n=1 Tax=Penaeicola halotolerans TaxID=2793196 RepID=UPI001CF82974|nr:GTP cyclohydrolase I FolE [Penaeicola halotolerans]
MKQREITLNTQAVETKKLANEAFDAMGDEHILSSINTPLREDAFEMDDDLKIEMIQKHFKEIMNILGLDLTDDSLKGTPHRVAKMYVKEIFSGLNPKNKPAMKLFENKYKYNEMLVEKDITFFSNCEHHFVPIYGKAHVAYISNGSVIGLSKLNRIVQYYAKRPQVQERLTVQIANELKEALGTDNVAIVIDAKHMCVSSRGIQDVNSATVTSHFSGKFQNEDVKKEFLNYLSLETKY